MNAATNRNGDRSLPSRLRRLLRLLRSLQKPMFLQLAATLLFTVFLLWRIDVREVAKPLGEANYAWVFLALALSFLERLIDTVRWRVYLVRVGRVPLLGLLGIFLIGNFVNNMLPMRAGDVAKIQIVASRYGLSRAGLASTVFMVENVMDALTFLCLLLISLALLDVGFVPVPLLWVTATIAISAFMASMIASRLLPQQLPQWGWLRALPPSVREGLMSGWSSFRDGLEAMRSFSLFGKSVSLNFAGWLTQAVMFWVFGLAFGLDLSFPSYMVVMVAANLVSAFPITFQNFGTYEVVVLEILAAWGVAQEEAFAYAAATHIVMNIWVAVLGLGALWVMRISPKEVFTLRGS